MRSIALILSVALSWPAFAQPLPGTASLEVQGDLASQMLDGIDRFLQHQTDIAPEQRSNLWHRDLSSPKAYEKSVTPNRVDLAEMIGLVDKRIPFDAPELIATTAQSAEAGRGEGVAVYAVRWPVVGSIEGEGLLLVPARKPYVADIIAVPDADQTPEMIAGLVPGIAPEQQFARRLAASGCRVLIPMLIDRSDTYSMPPSGQRTNQPHREYIYRPAYQVGRTIIAYEVQKILAAVDWFAHESSGAAPAKIGVIGYGEGGLLAFYAAALDTRINAACVSGYFASRQNLWQEPIYRNVFGLLREFGDAEIASLIAPRPLVIEACKAPHVDGPPAPHDGKMGAAPGRIVTPSAAEVVAEVKRCKQLTGHELSHLTLVKSGDNDAGPFGTDAALEQFLRDLGADAKLSSDAKPLESLRANFDFASRLKREIDQMQEFTQSLVRDAEQTRAKFWSRADRSSVENWQKSMQWYRDYFQNELIGKFAEPLLPSNSRTRKVYDEPKFTGYEVMLDVYPDVFAYGILLVPKDLKPGERRPVVVCQHGLDGRAQDVADPKIDSHYYHHFACTLAEQGFVTYAPQNPYIFENRFRQLVRMAYPLKASLFSIITPQHQQTVNWLASLPFVDSQRIAFYGLSYGGKTAVRVPPLIPQYCLSICSGDFNEWLWKTTSLTLPSGYPGTQEYEMFEWNVGNTFNYADMVGLIAPRPFMVERGHHDTVGIDPWVAYEYAKVRELYSALKIPDATTIEFFDGPHTIHGVGTYRFLREKLNWPSTTP
jgi:dienelactone hydrolase